MHLIPDRARKGEGRLQIQASSAPQLFWKMQMHARLASETTESTSAHHSRVTTQPFLHILEVPPPPSHVILSPARYCSVRPIDSSPPLIPLACFWHHRPRSRGLFTILHNSLCLSLRPDFPPHFALLSGLGLGLLKLERYLVGKESPKASFAWWLKVQTGLHHVCISLA